MVGILTAARGQNAGLIRSQAVAPIEHATLQGLRTCEKQDGPGSDDHLPGTWVAAQRAGGEDFQRSPSTCRVRATSHLESCAAPRLSGVARLERSPVPIVRESV